jgi:hypothetical protein
MLKAEGGRMKKRGGERRGLNTEAQRHGGKKHREERRERNWGWGGGG